MISKIYRYGEIKKTASYEIFVSRLFDITDYRVSLSEIGGKTVECLDLRLTRPSDRRELENYVSEKKKQLGVKDVWFGSNMYSNHYPLERYKEDCKNLTYIQDINL